LAVIFVFMAGAYRTFQMRWPGRWGQYGQCGPTATWAWRQQWWWLFIWAEGPEIWIPGHINVDRRWSVCGGNAELFLRFAIHHYPQQKP